MRTAVMFCAFAALCVSGQYMPMGGMGGMKDKMKEKKPMPRVETISCNEGVGTQAYNKALGLFNADINALRTYFTEQCDKMHGDMDSPYSFSMCPKRQTVAETEAKLCEIRALKSILYPSGATGQPAALSFDCTLYTPEEKRGCAPPSAASSAWQNIYTGLGANNGNAATGSPPRSSNPTWQLVIDEQVAEYNEQMKVARGGRQGTGQAGGYGSYLSQFAGGYGGTAAYGSAGGYNAYGSSATNYAATQASPAGFASFNAPGQRFARQMNSPYSFNGGNNQNPYSNQNNQNSQNNQNQYNTNQYSSQNQYNGRVGTQQAASNNQYGGTPGSPQPQVSAFGGYGSQQSSYMSSGIGGYGGPFGGAFNDLKSRALKKAMKIKACLPPGTIPDEKPPTGMGIGMPFLGNGMKKPVMDPSLKLCKLREDPSHFDMLEQKKVKEFKKSIPYMCDDPLYTTDIQQMSLQMSTTQDPVSFISSLVGNGQSTLTLRQMVVKRCAIRRLADKVMKEPNSQEVANLACDTRYATEIKQLQDEMMLKKMMMKDKDPQMGFMPMMPEDMMMGGKKKDPLKMFMMKVTCKSQSVRDIAFRKFGDMGLAICLMAEKMKAMKDSPYGMGMGIGGYGGFGDMDMLADTGLAKKLSDYMKMAFDRYVVEQVPLGTASNTPADNIWNNAYNQLVLPTKPDPLDMNSYINMKRDWLSISNAVFNQAQQCDSILNNNEVTRNFVPTMQNAVTSCRKGNKEAMKPLKDEIEDMMKMLSNSNTLQNNQAKICLKYKMITANPPTGGVSATIQDQLERVAFGKGLYKLVEKELKRETALQAQQPNCDQTVITSPMARTSLNNMLTAFASGDFQADMENDYDNFKDPSDLAIPMTDEDKTRYKACKATMMFDLAVSVISGAPGPMCSAFPMNELTQAVRNTINQASQPGSEINAHAEIMRIMMDSTIQSQWTRNLGPTGQSCNSNRVRETANNGVSSWNCPSGQQCCSEPFVCEDNQCAITAFQMKVCQKAAAAAAMSQQDAPHKFMKLLKKSDLIEKQKKYATYLKYKPNSPECNAIFSGQSSATGTQNSAANQAATAGYAGTQAGSAWGSIIGRTNSAGYSSNAYSSPQYQPFANQFGAAQWPFAQGSSTSSSSSSRRTAEGQTAMDILKGGMDGGAALGGAAYSAGYSAQNSLGFGASYGGMSGGMYGMKSECAKQKHMTKFICAFRIVYDDWARGACPAGLKRDPLFPTYDFEYNPADSCKQQVDGTMPSPYLPPTPYGNSRQKNEDCKVLTEAQQKAAEYKKDPGFIVLMKYKKSKGMMGGGAYGGSSAYSSAEGPKPGGPPGGQPSF